MSAETPTNPYSAFEKMTDEEVVLKAKEDNVLAQEYCCINTVNLCVPKPEVIF